MIARRGLAGLLTIGIAFALAVPAWAGEAFGVESFASSITSDEGGAGGGYRDLQAGSHPDAITTSVTFNHLVTGEEEGHLRVRTYGDPKDIEVNLPPGVIVDPLATEARCTEAELEARRRRCPNASAVGVFSIYLDDFEAVDEPIYNMVPPAGVPAELGFDAAGIGLIMHVGGRVRTGQDYGLSADISEIPDEHPIYGLELTLWGDPSDASHDQERGLCADEEAKQIFKQTAVRSSCPVERTAKPFLTLPSSCTEEPLTTTVNTDSWQQPGALNTDGTPDLGDPRWQTATSILAAADGLREPRLQPETDGRHGRTGSRARGSAERAQHRSEAAARRKRERCSRRGAEGSGGDLARGVRDLALGGRWPRSVYSRGDRTERRESALLSRTRRSSAPRRSSTPLARRPARRLALSRAALRERSGLRLARTPGRVAAGGVPGGGSGWGADQARGKGASRRADRSADDRVREASRSCRSAKSS